MKTEAYQCDSCETFMLPPTKDQAVETMKGFTFRGNVECLGGGGLIGNNLDDDGKAVKEVHYCKPCILKILGIKTVVDRGPGDDVINPKRRVLYKDLSGYGLASEPSIYDCGNDARNPIE